MQKKHLFTAFIAVAMTLVFACDSAQKKKTEDTTPKDTVTKTETKKDDVVKNTDSSISAGDAIVVKSINNSLKPVTISGFPLDSARVPQDQNMSYAKKIAPIIKPLVAKIPTGHVMLIKGHSCSIGSPKYRMLVSQARAKAVYDELINSGVPAAKVSWKGVGASEMVKGAAPNSSKQRRVSFVVVKK